MKRRARKTERYPADQGGAVLTDVDGDVELSEEELEAVVGGLTRPWQAIGKVEHAEAGWTVMPR